MANPVQAGLWGSEMSQEGVHNKQKHGGVRSSPHESSFDDGILSLSKDSLSADVRDITDVNSLNLVQDGGSISLLSGDNEDMADIYRYDHSTEWLKSNAESDSKCKSLTMDFDGVNEENVGEILGLGAESRVDSLISMGGQLLSSEDSGIILCADGVGLVSALSAGSDAKCSDIIPMCNILNDDLQNDRVLCASSSQNDAVSLLGSNSAVFSDITTSLESSGITFTAFTDKTMKLEQLESDDLVVRSGQTNILQSNSSLVSSQNLLGGSSITSVVSSVSDCGLTSIIPNFLGIDSSPGNELGILGDCSSGGEGFHQNMFLTCDSSDMTPGRDSMTKIDLNDPGNVMLAMISVSTDKDANSTQIVVNTSQGQQLYMINTACLGQAAVVAQPVTLDSGMQGLVTPAMKHHVLLPVLNGSVVGGILQEPLSPDEACGIDQYMCDEPGCDKAFSKRSKLKVHLMQHTGERPFKCNREGCGWAFTTAYKLKRHDESHEGKKDFDCEVPGCNRKFTTIYNLNTHVKLHLRPCIEECPEKGCGERFPTKRLLEAHMKVHNGMQKTYHCPYPGCKAMFYSAISIGSHSRIHKERIEETSELRCEFEGCGKLFDRHCRLKQHMRQHTGEKPYVCFYEGCSWAFTTASKLKRHSAKHQNIRKYKCDMCDKTFRRSEHLKGHRITHTGSRPFKCSIEGCDASFTAKSSLYVHQAKHDKDGSKMVFRCPLDGCSRKYSNKVMLRSHLSKHIINSSPTDPIGADIAQLLLHDQEDENEDIDEQCDGEQRESLNYKDDGVEITGNHLVGTAVSELLSQPVIITGEAPANPQPTISLESNQSRAVYLKNSSGCARTDFQSNHLISNQARQRWYQQRDEATQLSGSSEVDEPSSQTESTLGLVKQEIEMFASPECLTALTFRDPETGLTYVQTQLLQDDPPHTVFYNSDPMGINSDSNDVNSVMLDTFSSTTINLNDLV